MQSEHNMPKVGVGIVIRKESLILLLRRKNVLGTGSWSTPGGHLDFQEAPEVCALREVKEETNLDIQNPRFLAITNDVFPEEGKHYITIWMEAEYCKGEPFLNAPYESDAIGWFSWNELPEPLFISLQNLIAGQSYPPVAGLSRKRLE